jgi:GNAT superfamily N-acetyltransferase
VTGVVTVRAVRRQDAAALARMMDRCSPRTRFERFHGVVDGLPAEYLRRCLEGDRQEAVVAETLTGELVGLASTGPVRGEPDVVELGVLVEDRWQGRGIGRLLIGDMFLRAHTSGVRLVRLEMCRLMPGLLDYVVTRLPVAARLSDGCDVTVDIDADAAAAVMIRPPRSTPATARPRPPSAAPRPGAPAPT